MPPAATETWKSVGRSAGVRILLLPISAILGIVVTRLIVGHFGEAAYAQYGLLVGVVNLLPFADLGMSAAVMNVIAQSDDPAHDPAVRRVLTTALRVLIASCLVLALVTVIITVSGAWSTLLGRGLIGHSGPAAAAICLGIVAITIPVGIGQRILTGLGKNHVSVALVGLQTPIVLLALLLIIAARAPLGGYVAVAAYLATLLISAVATYVAARRIRPAAREALRSVFRPRASRGGRVLDVAWPMLIQMIALPIAMQTDRIVISHVSNTANLAEYNLASQIFTPVWTVTSAAGIALWPIFARARARADAGSPSPNRLAVGFGGAAAMACLVLGLATPWLAARASGGEIHIALPLIVAFSVFMVVQAVKFPLGMYMTDARGLRYQAWMIVIVLLPLNLGLSIMLAMRWGAVGPVVASAFSVVLSQVIANWCWVRRERARRRSAMHPVRAGAGA